MNTAGDVVPQKHHLEGKIFSEIRDPTRIHEGRPVGSRLQRLLLRGTWTICLQLHQPWRFCSWINDRLRIPPPRMQVSKSSSSDKPLEDNLRKAKRQDLLHLTQSHKVTLWGCSNWRTNLYRFGYQIIHLRASQPQIICVCLSVEK